MCGTPDEHLGIHGWMDGWFDGTEDMSKKVIHTLIDGSIRAETKPELHCTHTGKYTVEVKWTT